MPTNFPTSVDNFTNPTANDSLNLPSHSTQHANANDAIEAIENAIISPATYPDQLVNGTTSTVRPLPFAMAAGTAAPVWTASTNSAALTVTFPANRFTQGPVVFITNTSAAGALIGSTYRALSITSASFALNGAATSVLTTTGAVNWTAIQMTSASASG